jgi:hypothetical protein
MADLTVENEADLHRIHDSVSAIPGNLDILGSRSYFITHLIKKNRKHLHSSLILDE